MTMATDLTKMFATRNDLMREVRSRNDFAIEPAAS